MAATPVRYRNKKNGKVATYAHPMSRLEKSKDWERVDGKQEPKKQTGSSGS